LSRFASRLVPARPDLAAEHLRGQVAAARYAAGRPMRVTASLLDMWSAPDARAARTTQLLHGERFTVYEMRPDGIAWGQAALDGYVGYVAGAGLGAPQGRGVRVTAIWSQVYAEPSVRARVDSELPFLAEVPVAGTTGGYARLRGGGHVPRPHLEPVASDWVAQAERFLGVPYLWGGRSARGLDCSALVQLALLAAGHEAPRDSDMQEALLGVELAADAPPRRGDLVFWTGHVGIMQDAETLLHANGHHMAVASEPFAPAAARIAAAGGGPVTRRRRI
jgi:cell wall-associated NlpC family hydrolase